MRRLLAATFAAAVLSTTPHALAQTPPAPAAADTSKKNKNDELPLTTTRTVEFETSEGTWLSLDVRPTAGRSSSSCSAISTRCPRRVAPRHG